MDVGCTVFAVKNTEITVACRANSTSGSTKIEWFKNGYQMSDRFIGDVAAIFGSLKIRKLGRFNEGSYTCRASNDEGETEALFTAKIVGEFSDFKGSYYGFHLVVNLLRINIKTPG